MFPVNEVLQGDCTRVLRRLPDSFVDLVVTDPPYGVRYQDSKGRTIANDGERRITRLPLRFHLRVRSVNWSPP